MKLDKFKAFNLLQPEKVLFILVINDESKWLRSIDSIFITFESISLLKKLSKLVGVLSKQSLTYEFSLIYNDELSSLYINISLI